MNIFDSLTADAETRRGRLVAWLRRPNVKATAWTLAMFVYAVGLDAVFDHTSIG
jgi:hypothetical protein